MGQGGLAVRKAWDGFALSQILKYDHWESKDALAKEIDRLAKLGEWNGEESLAQDPARLCPPELKVSPELTKRGIRPAAQFYLQAKRKNDSMTAALEYAQEAVRLAPTWDQATEQLVEALVIEGMELGYRREFQEAVALLKESLRLGDKRQETWETLGLCLLFAGRTAEAETIIRKGLHRFPESGLLTGTLATALLSAGKGDEAVAQYRKAMKEKADLSGMRGEAVELMKKRPELHLGHFCLGLLYDAASESEIVESEKAVKEYEAYLKAQPKGKYAAQPRARVKALKGGGSEEKRAE